VRPDWSLLHAPAHANHAIRPPVTIPRSPVLFIVATGGIVYPVQPIGKAAILRGR
jgi:hypothetical protein